jgi:hypothetical protein
MHSEADIAALLHRLAAENAIRRLLSAYCDAVSRHDLAAARTLFAPSCRLQIADMPERAGIEAIVAGLGRTLSGFSFLQQRCDANLIDVTGHSARARVAVLEANRRIGEETLALIFGTYEDEYTLLPEGWRFAHRRFTLKLRAVLPASTLQEFPDLVPAFPIGV